MGGYYLPYGAQLDRRLDYLPAVGNFTKSYLLRTNGALAVPLVAPVSAKSLLSDEYNGEPASGAGHDRLFLTLGLSVVW